MLIEDRIEAIEILDDTVISNRKLVVAGQIKIAGSASLTIENSELLFEEGAGIICSGQVKLTNSTFAPGNSGKRWNGIILSEDKAGGSVIEKCVFKKAGCSDPEASAGGAITLVRVEEKPVKIKESTFIDCAGNFGGGLCVQGTLLPDATNMPGISVILENCRFEKCTGINGGALALLYRAGVEAHQCQFRGCEGKSAGAIYLYDNSFLTATGCSFEHCKAEVSGGAFTSRFSTLNLNQTTVKSCIGARSNTQGGACYLEKSNCQLTANKFSNCEAEAGGALRPVGGILKLERCEFENCTATVAGGAIAFSRDCESDIKDCEFIGCNKKSPTGVGNIIAFKNSSGDLQNCKFSQCQSDIISQEVSFEPDSSVTLVNCDWPKKSTWESFVNLFKGNS